MCLADYISLTDTIYNATNYKMQSEDEMSVDENTSDEEGTDTIINDNDIINLKKYFPIKLQNKLIIKFHKHKKIIRFVNYKYIIDPSNYCHEKLLLYIPWQKTENSILQKFPTYIEAYNNFQKQIHNKMKIYEPAAEIKEHALLEYEEHPDKFHPNFNSIIDKNINKISQELQIIDDENNFLLPDTQSNEYDLSDDLKIQKTNYIKTIITKPNIINKEEFINLKNNLNRKKYEFFLYIMEQEIQKNDNQIIVCLHGGAGTGKSYVLKAIYQGLYTLLNNKPGENTNDIITLLIAPTVKQLTILKDILSTLHFMFPQTKI